MGSEKRQSCHGARLATAGLALLVACALLLAGCTAGGAGAGMPAGGAGTWTLAVYLCGSDLESRQEWATRTLNELKESDIPANVTVVVQAGGAKRWHADEVAQNGCRLAVRGGEAAEVGRAGDASMGEAGTLAGFLAFVEEEYPAEHTAVVLWDHGGGPLVGACFDEEARFDALTLPELDEAFAAGVESRGGRPYDLVGFDACLMGSLETAALLADDAEWLVASEEIEAGAGWGYRGVLAAMGSGADGRAVGVAACDGYLQKSEDRGKAATATLSVVDLSQARSVAEALSEALGRTRDAKGSDVAAMRAMAWGVRQAQSFGGKTDDEGHTNLVDLGGAALAVTGAPGYGDAWASLVEALDAAVCYSVAGDAVSGARGLSIWYPSSSSADEVYQYAQASPLGDYADALLGLYGEDLGPVTFSDPGTVGADGAVSVTVAPGSADSFFDLYVANRRTDGTYADTTVDIYDDWDGLTFTYYPSEAVAMRLNGMVLDANVVSYGDGYQIFSSPVSVNGKTTNLRYCWVSDEVGGEGFYDLLGTWDGIDDATGMADRSFASLAPGDWVSSLSTADGSERDTVVLEGEPELDDVPLPHGSYECWFVALDLFGNAYPSAHVAYEVQEDGSITFAGA